MESLRDLALSVSADDLNIDASELPDGIFGVVMDMQTEAGLITVVAFANGAGSYYLSTGGGMIGGESHEAVRAAAQEAVLTGIDHRAAAKPAKSQVPPEVGEVRIFLRSTGGLRVMPDVTEEAIGEGDHALSPLFFAMHRVISELRKTAEQDTAQ